MSEVLQNKDISLTPNPGSSFPDQLNPLSVVYGVSTLSSLSLLPLEQIA